MKDPLQKSEQNYLLNQNCYKQPMKAIIIFKWLSESETVRITIKHYMTSKLTEHPCKI
jgi:hypothetical protein